MLYIFIVVLLSIITGYGILIQSTAMFITGTVGFVSLATNISINRSRFLDVLTFFICFGSIAYGMYLFYINSFLGA